jgi:chromosome partitioning protein
MCRVVSVITQKGGVGKTSITENIGVGLALNGRRVLLVDFDPQSTLSDCLGNDADDLDLPSIYDVMEGEINDRPVDPETVIVHSAEGVDLIPSSIALSGTEMELFNAMCRERMLASFLERIKEQYDYDYIFIDCGPSLGLLNINALAASDSVIIPMEPSFKSVKGMKQLMTSIERIRKKINPDLMIDGIVFNKVNKRANNHRNIMAQIREEYENVFATEIPSSVREAESSERRQSVYGYDKAGKLACAYVDLVDEFLEFDRSLETALGR